LLLPFKFSFLGLILRIGFNEETEAAFEAASFCSLIRRKA